VMIRNIGEEMNNDWFSDCPRYIVRILVRD